MSQSQPSTRAEDAELTRLAWEWLDSPDVEKYYRKTPAALLERAMELRVQWYAEYRQRCEDMIIQRQLRSLQSDMETLDTPLASAGTMDEKVKLMLAKDRIAARALKEGAGSQPQQDRTASNAPVVINFTEAKRESGG